MVTLQTADNALKSFYLDAVTDALNMKTNPLLAKIQRTSANVVGKDVRKVVRLGLNGGIGAGTETGDLPTPSTSEYVQLVATLKNLYGTIEISDKAIRSSANNEGAFVNLLNEEMQSLIKSASYNFGRMLFGDGSGKIASVTSVGGGNSVILSSTSGIMEGMLVSFCSAAGAPNVMVQKRRVLSVDRAEKKIYLDGSTVSPDVLAEGSWVYIQDSNGHEITGLKAIFSENPIYAVNRNTSMMRPYIEDGVGDISENLIQKAMDTIEENAGSKINYIVCSWGVKRALVEYYKQHDVILPTMEIEGGFTALNFNGVPVVADRFCPEGTMYLLNTDDFKLHQLCDWQWLESEDGKILKQVAGKPVYTATLVKYAELMCERPCGQGMITGIEEA
ncbi:MAG: phage major capsid protein [Clostridia bacterium]|nr:phage major capsid protein [Clostridia bacterium]